MDQAGASTFIWDDESGLEDEQFGRASLALLERSRPAMRRGAAVNLSEAEMSLLRELIVARGGLAFFLLGTREEVILVCTHAARTSPADCRFKT